MKVLFTHYGSFGFSRKFNILHETLINNSIGRHDVSLIEAVESFGLRKASIRGSKLDIEFVPDGCKYKMDVYNEWEHIVDTWINVSIEELRNGLSEDKIELAMKCSSIRIDH